VGATGGTAAGANEETACGASPSTVSVGPAEGQGSAEGSRVPPGLLLPGAAARHVPTDKPFVLSECARDSHPFVPCGRWPSHIMLYKSARAPNQNHSTANRLLVPKGRVALAQRAHPDVAHATAAAGRPCQPINRFQQISASLRATATRAFLAPARLRIRW
jgi:hypothetical protein